MESVLQDVIKKRRDVIVPMKEELIKRLNLPDRKSTRLNSSHTVISYAVFCLKKKKNKKKKKKKKQNKKKKKNTKIL
mgnify:CR=1 FL=1